ncbi:MAG: polysaccharide deacetylase family protein [Clostridioides sp.]|jgi:polysaccharide deacetylase family sporulation protein PdaB|nr:polysaccharide deacetylase family protein [Clostridioides sp.]
MKKKNVLVGIFALTLVLTLGYAMSLPEDKTDWKTVSYNQVKRSESKVEVNENQSTQSKEINSIVFSHGSKDEKLISLTFDDGPHPTETDKVLDVLKKYNIKATFFVAGKHVKWYPDPVIRASKEGHEIGNHTFNHYDIANLSNAQLEDEIKMCEDVIKEKTGKTPTLFRPPYGSYSKNGLPEIADKNGYKIVLWGGVDALDWKNPSAESIAKNITSSVENGEIILLHDYATTNTVEALEILIPQLQSQGYKFVTVSQLLSE